MARRRVPVLNEKQVQDLRTRRKNAKSNWKALLLDQLVPGVEQGRLMLSRIDAPQLDLHGRFTVFARRSLHRPHEDFSAGLVFTDDDQNSYVVVRCNGPHGTHTNRHDERVLSPQPHVHYLTERYLRLGRGARPSPEGFAIGGGTWKTLPQAVDALALRARIDMNYQQRADFEGGGHR